MTDDATTRRILEQKPLPYVKVEPRAEACSGCPLCEPSQDRHCPKCCDLGFPF